MGVYGQEAGAGRGLEHDIVCRDRGCLGGKEADRRRCRELLERDLRFATHALRGKRRRHSDQLGEPRIRICRERRVLQMEDLREFEHIVGVAQRPEEHTSELQSLMRISYAVFCLKKKKQTEYIVTDDG